MVVTSPGIGPTSARVTAGVCLDSWVVAVLSLLIARLGGSCWRYPSGGPGGVRPAMI